MAAQLGQHFGPLESASTPTTTSLAGLRRKGDAVLVRVAAGVADHCHGDTPADGGGDEESIDMPSPQSTSTPRLETTVAHTAAAAATRIFMANGVMDSQRRIGREQPLAGRA